jgi:hypothetical protein
VNGAQGITVTAINVTLSGNPAGNTICFAVKARDNAGHVSGLGIKPKCTELPIDDKQFSSHPGFTQKTVSGTYHGTVLRATAKGSQIAASGIHAKHLAVLVTKCPGCGTIKVIFKGAQVGSNISLNASTTKKKVLVLLPAFSNAKSGTLVVRVVSSGKRVDIDGVGTSLV